VTARLSKYGEISTCWSGRTETAFLCRPTNEGCPTTQGRDDILVYAGLAPREIQASVTIADTVQLVFHVTNLPQVDIQGQSPPLETLDKGQFYDEVLSRGLPSFRNVAFLQSFRSVDAPRLPEGLRRPFRICRVRRHRCAAALLTIQKKSLRTGRTAGLSKFEQVVED
jgi:hypothetical protein